MPPETTIIFELTEEHTVRELQPRLKIREEKARKLMKLLNTKEELLEARNPQDIDEIKYEWNKFLRAATNLNVRQAYIEEHWANWHFNGAPVWWLLGIDQPCEDEESEAQDEISEEAPLQEIEEVSEAYVPSKKVRAKMRKECAYAFYIKDGDVNAEKIEQKEHNLGGRTVNCEYCSAKLWPDETSAVCCQKGLVNSEIVPPMIPLPSSFRKYYYGTDTKSRNFRRYINSFNNSFCMTSAGVDRYYPPGRGPPVFAIQGVPHHRSGSLRAPEGDYSAKYAQLYLVDTAEAADIRIAEQRSKYFKSKAAKAIMKELGEWLVANNEFVAKFKMAIERQEQDEAEDLCLIFEDKGPANSHQGRWNAPSSRGLCGLITNINDINEKERYRDIILHCKGSTRLQSICELNELYDPLHYVLLFPTGIYIYMLYLSLTKHFITIYYFELYFCLTKHFMAI